MGNLGAYQVMTTLAKRVGGPKVLGLLTALGGYGVFRLGEAAIKKIVHVISEAKKGKQSSLSGVIVYSISGSYSDSHGLVLNAGDSLHVLDKVDEDVLLVEKLGDEHNPYCMSPSCLAAISDYHT